ncbi:MAG: hypothetical protein UX13_C0033G0007 [Candidatus Woesebacteria bacterium GW2011_GWB1_45_5]|uniref:Uncharacterized protein n=1 Tax=Candidatus Woesebacteria bacterium GW2011_GWB1_45_5 TaxID=1618581 RepID=A0A0G1MNL9_9BACT|nr:MAG: hypothetical protein UX13_C0033G0007 [Candidatus Woesebacteria bacterium GW2011_GWB1_45_5]
MAKKFFRGVLDLVKKFGFGIAAVILALAAVTAAYNGWVPITVGLVTTSLLFVVISLTRLK